MSRGMSGFNAWLLQRATAVYLGLFIPIALIYMLLDPPSGYPDWLNRMGNPWVFSTVSLFALALLLHAWIGMRDIVLDYVKPHSLRLLVLLAIAAALILSGLWLAMILLNALRIT